MRKKNMPKLLLGTSVTVIFVGLALFAAGSSRFRGSVDAQHQAQPNQSKRKNRPNQQILEIQKLEARFPKTDYDAAEPANPEEKAMRKNKNKHWDGRNLVMRNPSGDGSATSEMDERFNRLPALPVGQSDVVLTAEVVNSAAHLSNERNGSLSIGTSGTLWRGFPRYASYK